MDYIITDRVTSPLELASQFSEKLAFMPKTFFVGDHRQMFPHMRERVIITVASSPSENGKVADNVALVNGTDLSPILERTDIKKVKKSYQNIHSFFKLKEEQNNHLAGD